MFRGICNVLETCRPKCDMKISDRRVAGDLCLCFVLFFTMYFHHVCRNFSGVLYLVALFWSNFPEQSTLYIQHCSETWSSSSCKKLRFKLENQGSTALWVGWKIPEYSRSSLPLIASQQVAGLKQNLTSKRKSHATHPLHREAKTKIKVSNSSTWERLQLGTKKIHSSLNIRSASNPFQIHVLETSCSIRSNIDTSTDTTPNQHQVGRQVQETPHNVASSG